MFGRVFKQNGLKREESCEGAEPTPRHHNRRPLLIYIVVKVRSNLVLQSCVTDDLSGHVGTLRVHFDCDQRGCLWQQPADADSGVAAICPQLERRGGRCFHHDGVQNGSWTSKVASGYCETL